ncbi:hypothetical protein [Lentibacillus sp. Marseille-P4043]|uniref:hypothetical protein n=1 Tax=Lentibacillus sp. Marseille-P4043 TaxID=2040293 RepID=UPI000D0B3F54|nr:hypothetical protein [Lentibacillus sp. Marseille-P4043]
MNEWLTTGQMIDRLKVGGVAVGDASELGIEVKVFKDKTGHIKLCDSEGLMMLSAGFVDSVQWRILPNHVSFEEAMRAYKKGKVVNFYYEGIHTAVINPEFYDKESLDELLLSDFTLKELLEGKWTIEGGDQ